MNVGDGQSRHHQRERRQQIRKPFLGHDKRRMTQNRNSECKNGHDHQEGREHPARRGNAGLLKQGPNSEGADDNVYRLPA